MSSSDERKRRRRQKRKRDEAAREARHNLNAFRLDCVTTCVRCRTAVRGWVMLDDRLAVSDSGGFLIAGVPGTFHSICDACARAAGMPMRDELIHSADDIDEALVESMLRAYDATPPDPTQN